MAIPLLSHTAFFRNTNMTHMKQIGTEATLTTKTMRKESPSRSRKRRDARTSDEAVVPESHAIAQGEDGSGVGNSAFESKSVEVRAATVNAIVIVSRRRTAAVRACVALTNQRLAFIRSALGFQTADEEASRKEAIAASQAIDNAAKTGDMSKLDEHQAHVCSAVMLYCQASREAERQFHDTIIKPCEKELGKLVERLPEWAGIGSIRGMGALLLAEIIGTVGDLAQYRGPRSLRKMLGAAPHNGKALSTWKRKGGLSADEWVAVGSNPNRFCLLFRMGDCQIKSRGPYRAIYDERKVQEAARLDEHGKPVTPMIAHRRALRVMVSRMLNDLWAYSKGLTPIYKPTP